MKAWQRITTMRPNDARIPLSTPSFLVLVGLVGAACSAAPVPGPRLELPPVAPVFPREGFDPDAYRAFDVGPPAALDPVFDPHAPAACRWAAASWGGPLRLRPELEPFAKVDSASAVSVVITEGDASQGARISLEVLGVRLNGLVAASDLEIHPKAPQLVAGFAWIGPASVLRWTGAVAGRLTYEVVLPARISPATGPLSGEQACEELSVADGGGDDAVARAMFVGRRSVLRARWSGNERVPLSRAPGQPPLAQLDTRATCASDEAEGECEAPEPDEVWVFDERAGWVRVAFALETVAVVGWVPKWAVQQPFDRIATDELALSFAPWGEPAERFGANDPTLALREQKVLCAWNAPLAAETSGLVREVGRIASGIPLLAGAQRQGWQRVALEHPALTFEAGAEVWVPARLLYPCRQ